MTTPQVPNQFTTANGKANWISYALLGLTAVALFMNIYSSHKQVKALKKHELSQKKEEDTQLNKIAELEKKVQKLSSKENFI